MTEYVRPLSALGRGDLAWAGGKAANLGELLRAGQAVPPGFCILTSAYAEFVDSNGLRPRIQENARAVDPGSPSSLEEASQKIGRLFDTAAVPGGMVDAIRASWAALGADGGVAVRSSATAEDLPDASFAGQQDTYLNVVGEAALLAAVVRCWASLWTARAIGYRLRAGIPHAEAALAVVVQVMVQSEVSGVLFTANPLTGNRTQTAIDATVGLGEALVAGKVEPDHYLVQAGTILSRSMGAKALSVRSRTAGGTETVAEAGTRRAALSDAQVLELEKRGREVEAHFGSPQDIEWAWADGKLFLLQARPITSLFPLPAGLPAGEPTVLLSLAQIQGMFDPFTPLGYDLFRHLAVGFGRIFGLHRTEDTQRGMFVAGSRLWLNLTPLFRFRLGRRILGNVLVPFIDPSLQPVVDRLLQDPRLSGLRRMKARTRLGFIRILVPTFVGVARCLLDPAKARRRLFRRLDVLAARVAAGHAHARSTDERVRVIERMVRELPALFFGTLIPAVASGQASRQLLRRASSGLADRDARVMQVMRGLPFNVTTEMDLVLWETARTIRTDAAAARRLMESDPVDLAREYLEGTLPGTAQAAMASFLGRYGMRAVGEIDIGRPRWREDPASLFSALAACLRIDDEHASPDAVFRRGAEAADQAAEGLISALRAQPGGNRSARRARFAIGRLRNLMGLREAPKLGAVRAFGATRDGLLRSGAEMVRQGVLSSPNDIFFLLLDDLRAMAAGARRDWQALVAERRRSHDRESRRRAVPRLVLSDGTAFHEGVTRAAPGFLGGDHEERILGSAVSPGVAEGLVRVVRDPRSSSLAPGEILVCVGTDPAWTPLFLAAAGLVMEVGGMMTHGSVVAREYGIPAVVGVDRATTRLRTGQRVRVDGNDGVVTLLST